MEYQSNSFKSKDNNKEDKKIEKIVSGTVIAKKPTPARKFAESMIAEDAKDVGSYILFDVIIPAVKDTISNIVSNGIDMLLFGSTGNGHSPKRHASVSSNYGKISYSSISTNKANASKSSYISSENYDYNEIILDSRGEAQDVLYHMQDILEEYKMVSIADLYELVGVQSNFTDNQWGWFDLSGASVERLRNGTYLLKFPKITCLN